MVDEGAVVPRVAVMAVGLCEVVGQILVSRLNFSGQPLIVQNANLE